MERRHITISCVLVFLLLATIVLFSACSSKTTESSPVERGKYLVMAGRCGECHSPKTLIGAGPAADATELLSGYPSGAKLPETPKGILGPAQWGAITTNDMTAWVGSWGVSFSYNLTPDPATGIGNWSEALFIQSLRTGRFMGTSRPMLPPMPWQRLGKMSDDDLEAIFAYLRSQPPVNNPIPEPIPSSQQ